MQPSNLTVDNHEYLYIVFLTESYSNNNIMKLGTFVVNPLHKMNFFLNL